VVVVHWHVLGSWTTSFTSLGMLAAALNRFDMVYLVSTGGMFVVQCRPGVYEKVGSSCR